MAGKQRDAAVRIGPFGAVFQVSLDGTAHVGELAADLVVTAGIELHFQKEIAFRGLDELVFEPGLFPPGGDVGLVLTLVPAKEVGK